MDDKEIRVAVGLTGSMHKVKEMIPIIKNMIDRGYKLKVFATESLKEAPEIQFIEEIINDKVLWTIQEAEPFGPSKAFDLMVIAPLTGNSLSKLANAITDNAVLMTAKSILRNNRPLVLAISTNDALGLNGSNLMKLLVSKHIYFVPFYQDNPIDKPNSLISDFTKIEDTIKFALKGKQFQPIIIVKHKEENKT
jgi:dipicolinate synthase subunit B